MFKGEFPAIPSPCRSNSYMDLSANTLKWLGLGPVGFVHPTRLQFGYIRVKSAAQKKSRNRRNCLSLLNLSVIAGGGFEPPTSGLWARRATRLLYPAVNRFYYTLQAAVSLTQPATVINSKSLYGQSIGNASPYQQKKPLFQIPANLRGNLFDLSFPVMVRRPLCEDPVTHVPRDDVKVQMLHYLAGGRTIIG